MIWYEDFDDIVNFLEGIEMYTSLDIIDRATALQEVYTGLKNGFGWGDELFLNPALVFHTVKSYYEDISREKYYHRIRLIDEHKKAAYTLKWVAKIRPICVTEDVELNGSSLNANEIFAVWAGLNQLKNMKVEDVPRNLYESLLYSAAFRDINPKELAQTMYSLEYIGKVRTSTVNNLFQSD